MAEQPPAAARFKEPGWFTRHVFNPVVAGLTRIGLPIAGSRVLEVKGRKSGEWRGRRSTRSRSRAPATW
jgi:hypothetical protein